LVRAGEVIPVDGVIKSPSAILDEAAVTGEPIPVNRQTPCNARLDPAAVTSSQSVTRVSWREAVRSMRGRRSNSVRLRPPAKAPTPGLSQCRAYRKGPVCADDRSLRVAAVASHADNSWRRMVFLK